MGSNFRRREAPGGGAELGRLACSYGVPRFVPSVRKEHFRMMDDLGLDETVTFRGLCFTNLIAN